MLVLGSGIGPREVCRLCPLRLCTSNQRMKDCLLSKLGRWVVAGSEAQASLIHGSTSPPLLIVDCRIVPLAIALIHLPLQQPCLVFQYRFSLLLDPREGCSSLSGREVFSKETVKANCFRRCLQLCSASHRASCQLRGPDGDGLWSIKLVSRDKIDEFLMRFLRSPEGYPEMLQNKQTGEIMNGSKAARQQNRAAACNL